jgi:copper chaperone CopZ
MLACLCVVMGLVACQKDKAEQSAEKVAKVSPAPAVAAAPAPAPAVAMVTGSHEGHEGAMAPGSCGCGGAASCSGGCGESCAGNGPAPQWTALPANATWQPLHVDGMMCGGCGKRIEKALANVDGVLAVKTDFRTKKVEIATKPGIDARALVKPTIDGLGYSVQ